MIIFLRSLIFNILFYIWTLLIAFFSFPVFFFSRKYNVKVWFLWIKVTNKILNIVTKLNYETKGLKKPTPSVSPAARKMATEANIDFNKGPVSCDKLR